MFRFKIVLFNISIGLIGLAAQADFLDNDRILRLDDGSIHFMQYSEAAKACPTGTHLPTSREYAEEAGLRKSQKILEYSKVDPKNVPEGYQLVAAVDVLGKTDKFYVNNDPKGYKKPAGDLGRNLFWSWSTYKYFPFYTYMTSGDSGDVFPSFRSWPKVAVRCFDNK